MEKYLDTPFVEYILTDDLLIGTYKKSRKITLEMAKEIVRVRRDFTGPDPVRALVYNQGVVTIDKKARDYLTSDEGASGFTAVAIILGNPFSTFFVNFFVSVTKVKMPVRTFYKKDAALKWLEKFKK
jgi:hypothetical protein